jgi:hypothetical protein
LDRINKIYRIGKQAEIDKRNMSYMKRRNCFFSCPSCSSCPNSVEVGAEIPP